MSSQVVEKAIRDVVPSLSQDVPDQLKQLTLNLYLASKNKINLRPNEEIARHHLSAYIATDRLSDRLRLPAPSLKNFPVPAKSAASLLGIFKLNLLSESTSSTPNTTPRKRPIPTTPSPQKRARGRPPGTKTKTEFQKKLEAAAATDKSIKNELIEEEIGPKDLKLLTSREITSLCNKFQLDSEIVSNILKTFQKYSRKLSNEWSLIVGLILNCYFVVNHKILKENIGFKTNVIKSMLTEQQGGLMLVEIQASIEIVSNLIIYNKWFKSLKNKYDYPIYELANLDQFGSMISSNYQFSSKKSINEYNEWKKYVLQ